MSKTNILIFSLGINILALALPLSVLQVYDRIVPNQSWGSAEIIFGATTLALVGAGFLRYVRGLMFAHISAEVTYSQNWDTASRLFARRRDAVQARQELETIEKQRDLFIGQGAVAYYDAPFTLVFLSLVWFLGGVVVWVPLAALAVVILYLSAVGNIHRGKIQKSITLRSEQDAALNDLLLRSDGKTTLQAIGPGLAEILERSKALVSVNENLDATDTRLLDIQQSVALIGTVGIVGAGAGQVLAGEMTSGGLAACTLLSARAVSQGTGVLVARFRRQALSRVDIRSEGDGSEDANSPLAAHLQRSKEGVVVVPSREVGGWADLALAQVPATVAIAPRVPAFLSGSLLENMSGFSRAREEKAEALADQLGLARLTDHLAEGYRVSLGSSRPVPLSQGAQRLASLVRSLVSDAQHVVLVDPTYHLDPTAISALILVLRDLQPQTRTVLVVTDDPAFAADLESVVTS